MQSWQRSIGQKQIDRIRQVQQTRKCPGSLKRELESAIKDCESVEYITWLKERIAKYTH